MNDAEFVPTPVEIVDCIVDEFFYLTSEEVRGKRFRIRAKIVGIDIRNGWFYECCPKCRLKLFPKNNVFVCDQDGRVPPDFIMQLNLLVADESGRIKATVFGKPVEDLIGIQLIRTIANQCLDRIKLPAWARDPSNDVTEYVFILGVTDQTVRRGFIRYKVYSYSQVDGDSVPDLSGGVNVSVDNSFVGADHGARSIMKGKAPVTSSSNPCLSKNASANITSPGNEIHRRIADASVDTPDCPSIPSDLFVDESPSKRTRQCNADVGVGGK